MQVRTRSRRKGLLNLVLNELKLSASEKDQTGFLEERGYAQVVPEVIAGPLLHSNIECALVSALHCCRYCNPHWWF